MIEIKISLTTLKSLTWFSVFLTLIISSLSFSSVALSYALNNNNKISTLENNLEDTRMNVYREMNTLIADNYINTLVSAHPFCQDDLDDDINNTIGTFASYRDRTLICARVETMLSRMLFARDEQELDRNILNGEYRTDLCRDVSESEALCFLATGVKHHRNYNNGITFSSAEVNRALSADVYNPLDADFLLNHTDVTTMTSCSRPPQDVFDGMSMCISYGTFDNSSAIANRLFAVHFDERRNSDRRQLIPGLGCIAAIIAVASTVTVSQALAGAAAATTITANAVFIADTITNK